MRAGTAASSRWRSIAINTALALISAAVAAAGIEALLAAAKVNTKLSVTFDPATGIGRVPNGCYVYTKEGFSQGCFNEGGFRDKRRTRAKPEGTFRILVLGDSFGEALEVALESTFPAIMERELNGGPDGGRFEVLNLSQQGLGTTDEYLRYVHEGRCYDPDVVIVAFFAGNDIRNNSESLNHGRPGCYFVLDGTGGLALDRTPLDRHIAAMPWRRRALIRIKQKSFLVSFVLERVTYLKRLAGVAPAGIEEEESGEGGNRESVGDSSYYAVYRPGTSRPWEEAYEITRQVFLKFKDAVEADGAQLVLVLVPGAEQVYGEQGRRLNQRFGIDFDFERPNRIVESYAREAGIPCLDLAPAFAAHQQRTGEYLHGFGGRHSGHWNEKGHSLAAGEIVRFLKASCPGVERERAGFGNNCGEGT